MKVLTYNIHGWQAPDGTLNLARLADVIAASGADVVGLNEVFHPLGMDGPPALEALAGQLGMAYAFGAALDAGESRRGVPYGNAVLSRWPILAHAVHHLPAGTRSARSERRSLVEVRILPPAGRPLTVYTTHLEHRSEELRLEQWAAARAWLVRDRDRPHLLIGDFNALAPADCASAEAVAAVTMRNNGQGWGSPAFDLVVQVLKAGYVDAFAAAGTGAGQTWPADRPERRIDYVFLSRAWLGGLIGCRRWDHPLVPLASDHFPVLAEFA